MFLTTNNHGANQMRQAIKHNGYICNADIVVLYYIFTFEARVSSRWNWDADIHGLALKMG